MPIKLKLFVLHVYQRIFCTLGLFVWAIALGGNHLQEQKMAKCSVNCSDKPQNYHEWVHERHHAFLTNYLPFSFKCEALHQFFDAVVYYISHSIEASMFSHKCQHVSQPVYYQFCFDSPTLWNEDIDDVCESPPWGPTIGER